MSQSQPQPQPCAGSNGNSFQPRGPSYESWVGIPPMYHETWLSAGQRGCSWIRGPTGRIELFLRHATGPDFTRSILPDEVSPNNKRLSVERGTRCDVVDRAGPDMNEKRRMPVHLLPFIPFVEKSLEASGELQYWKNEGRNQIDTIRNWLDTCGKLHGTRCGTVSSSGSQSWSGPLWLIDVEDGRLVSAPSGAVYVALSYVWGERSASASATISNLDLLQQEQGLYKDVTMLPRVVTDAIELVRNLGKRFLWVDRFCIVQDDGIAKQCQLNAMGSIYANAYFTLVAAQNEDATHGLYANECKASDPVDATRSKASAGFTDTEVLLDHAMHLMRSKWYSRGWTLQEYLLSKRRVVFHNNTVNWECLCASWHESQNMENVAATHQPQVGQRSGCVCKYTPQTGFEFESLPWPNMFRYARLVSMFNRRDLTFPEDVFDAFAGILSHLSRTFPGGFISGLPQMCFDAALLWQPWTIMTRRKSIGRSPSGAVLPSWSWGGWAGNINSESWRSAANYLFEADDDVNAGQQCSWKTTSTVKWMYSIDLASPRKEVRIPSSFAHPNFEARDDGTMPAGWSAQSSTEGSGNVMYYHSSDPSHPFRYPIPIRDQHKAHIPPVTARYLHGATTRGFLALGSKYNSIASNCPAIDLLTQDGKWSGVLRLYHVSCIEDVFRDGVKGENTALVELIEISEGEVKNQPIEEKSFDEWNREGCPRYQGLYQFVNVLWVDWKDGVAYRRALGRVVRRVWREVATEKIDITLG